VPGATLEVSSQELDRLGARLNGWLKSVTKTGDVMEVAAAILESQTRRRIDKEKTEPVGERWVEWSEKYRRTRHGNQSILVSSGSLLDDIASEADTKSASAFTSMIYGPTHQFGDEDRNIEARPFLGVSKDNVNEIENAVSDWLQETL